MALKLNQSHALKVKEGFLVVGLFGIEIQSERKFGSVTDWKQCKDSEFFEAFNYEKDRQEKAFREYIFNRLDNCKDEN